MAAKKESSDSATSPISDASIDLLGDVKKGKPRKFVMICKGTSIVSLVLFKKGSPDKYAKEAKKAGAGQVYHGVAVGRGNDINFQLARTDGFDSAPVKNPTLKTFLAEEADFKCAPVIEIIDTLGIVFDEDDPVAKAFLGLQDAIQKALAAHPDQESAINTLCRQIGGYLDADQSEKARDRVEALQDLLASLGAVSPSPVESSSSPPPNVTAVDFATRLKQFKPAIDEVIQAKVAVSAELATVVVQMGTFAKQGDFTQAAEKLTQAVTLVKTGREQMNAGSGSDPAALFLERIKAIRPEIDRAKASGGEEGKQIVLLASEAAVCGRKQDYAQANRLLDQLEVLLKKPSADQGSSKNLAEQWNRRLAELEPKYLSTVSNGSDDAAKLRVVWDYATAQASTGHYEKALQALQRLEPMLAALATPPKGSGESPPNKQRKVEPLVAFRQVRLAWDEARKRLQSQLQALEKAMLAACQNEPDYDAIVSGSKNIYQMLEQLDTRLIDKLDEALNADDPTVRRKLHDEALDIVDEYLDFSESDDLLQDIDDNGFEKTSILSDLTTSLEEMSRQLATAQ